MEFRTSITTAPDASRALTDLCEPLAGITPDLAILFVTPDFGPSFNEFVGGLRDTLDARNLIGATCEGVIGVDREVEKGPAAALWVASLPGVRVFPFVLDQNDFVTLKNVRDWEDRLGVTPDDVPSFIILPDPFSVQFAACLKIMDEVYPGSTTVGGVLSGASVPGKNRLFLNDQVLRQGMVGVSLTGNYRVSTIVSQGCRPVGPPFVITKADSNVIFELGGREAYAVLKELHASCSKAEQTLMQNGLHVGRAIDERSGQFAPGDFLIRNVAGFVNDTGVAVTDYIRAGQTVQFHVRDATTADVEMRHLIESNLAKMTQKPVGGLLFNCNGRGTRLFAKPHHDIRMVNELIPRCPVAGFFAAGEIGPVGGKTFVHGLTSSLILFHKGDETAVTEPRR